MTAWRTSTRSARLRGRPARRRPVEAATSGRKALSVRRRILPREGSLRALRLKAPTQLGQVCRQWLNSRLGSASTSIGSVLRRSPFERRACPRASVKRAAQRTAAAVRAPPRAGADRGATVARVTVAAARPFSPTARSRSCRRARHSALAIGATRTPACGPNSAAGGVRALLLPMTTASGVYVPHPLRGRRYDERSPCGIDSIPCALWRLPVSPELGAKKARRSADQRRHVACTAAGP